MAALLFSCSSRVYPVPDFEQICDGDGFAPSSASFSCARPSPSPPPPLRCGGLCVVSVSECCVLSAGRLFLLVCVRILLAVCLPFPEREIKASLLLLLYCGTAIRPEMPVREAHPPTRRAACKARASVHVRSTLLFVQGAPVYRVPVQHRYVMDSALLSFCVCRPPNLVCRRGSDF